MVDVVGASWSVGSVFVLRSILDPRAVWEGTPVAETPAMMDVHSIFGQ